tara:strand:+ start:17269 stop:17538 length:270 start_codon:yes stop_codon:yes gene_type:complete
MDRWRPVGWKSLGNPDTHSVYEAGADAMLEALKSKDDTVRLNMDGVSRIPAHGKYPEIIIEGKPYDLGWLVFIPEDAHSEPPKPQDTSW